MTASFNGARLATAPVAIAAAMVFPGAAEATDLFVTPFTQIATEGSYSLGDPSDVFEMRKVGSTQGGFKRGWFRWDPAAKAWVQQGSLKQDDRYFGSVRLWKKYYADDGSLSSEALDIAAGGADVDAVEFTAPSGNMYPTLCQFEGTNFGIKLFSCAKELSPGQTEFGDGKYVITFTLTSGDRVTRSYFVSGTYPSRFKISAPTASATGVPIAPTLKWTAVGGVFYDVIIRDANNDASVYGAAVGNAIESTLTHDVPSGVLQPDTTYWLTIEPNGPVVNGGSKGVRKRVQFTTAP